MISHEKYLEDRNKILNQLSSTLFIARHISFSKFESSDDAKELNKIEKKLSSLVNSFYE